MKNRILHASSKQVVRTGGFIDQFRRNLTDSLTPERLGTLLKEIDDGDFAAMAELAQEMEAKDAHLQAVANTRRQAVTALDWSIEPTATEDQDEFAIEVAKFCEDTLRSILSWPDTLDHLSRAIGPTVARTRRRSDSHTHAMPLRD